MDYACSICLENYSPEAPPIELVTCKHIFHEKCTDEWNTQCQEKAVKTLCPLCKVEFKKKDMKLRQDILTMIIKKLLQIQCKVVLPDEKIISIPVNNSKPVSDLCKIVEIYSSIPVAEHIYNFGGKQFSYEQDASKMLTNFGLTEGATIIMTQKLKLFQIFLKKLDGSTSVLQLSSDMPMEKFYAICEYSTEIPKEVSRFQAGAKAFSIQTHCVGLVVGDLNIHANMTIFQLARMKGGKK